MAKKKTINWKLGAVAIIALVGLQIGAWYMGKDGVVTGTVLFLIGSILGLSLPQIKFK